MLAARSRLIIAPVDTDTENSPRLADFARPVWQRKWLVLLVVVLATGVTYARSVRQPKIYDTGTLVYYQPGGDPLNGGTMFTSDRTVQDVAGLLYSLNTADAVAKRISFPGTPGALIGQTTITARTGQDFVAISASAHSPVEAAAIANGYAAELVSRTNADQAAAIAKELRGARDQLAQLGNGPLDQTTRQTLATEATKLRLALTTPTGTRQVSPAAVPAKATSPKPTRDAVYAFVLGLVFAVAVAFGLERFDRRLKSPEDLERAYGLPLLAVLPHSVDPAPRTDGVVQFGPGFHESFGLLRTNIQLLTLDSPPRTIAVVSAIPGEGKSTVVRNLAISFCEAGKRVVIVEADLRRPMQSGLFGLEAGPGVTEVLAGAASLGDALHHVLVRARGIAPHGDADPETAAANATNGRGAGTAGATITVLLAGTPPPNPATILESERVREMLDELSAAYDVVLIDSAPMLSVTDAVPLVRYADTTLVVGRMGLLTRDSVRRMVAFIGRIPDSHVVGAVANDLDTLGADGYSYGYGGYGYAATDESNHLGKKTRAERKRDASAART